MIGHMRELWEKALSLFRKRALDSEFNEELSAHIEMAVEDNIRAGMNPEEARRSAMIRLGGADQTCEVHREARGFGWIADLQSNCGGGCLSCTWPGGLRSRLPAGMARLSHRSAERAAVRVD